MYYPEEIVEQVRSGNNIVDVIGSYVRLQKKGSSYFGLCPFHNEKSPSFSVSENKQMFYCFGCGVGGNVFSFLMQYENLSFQEAIRQLADRAGITLPEIELSQEQKAQISKRQGLLQVNKDAAAFYYHLLRTEEGSAARQYLDRRALSEDIRKKFGLGYSGKYSNALYLYLKKKGYNDELLTESGLILYREKTGASDRFWNRVMFPIMDINNKVVAFGGRVMGDGQPKYLNSPETAVFEKSAHLYGLNYAKTTRKPYLIICEGYMDVIAMHQAGFTNAVASLGTAFTARHSVLIKRYTKEVCLAYDSDGAGQKAAMRAIPILENAGINVRIIHMDPYKDPDEFIKNLGSEAFEKRIEEAEPSFMFEISVAEKQFRMSDPAGRSLFLQQAARMMLRFPEEVVRNVYIEAFCSKYGVDQAAFVKMVNRLGASVDPLKLQKDREETDEPQRTGPSVKKKVHADDALVSAQKHLMTWIVEVPELMDKLKGLISEEDFDDPLYRKVYEMLSDEYEQTKKMTPARLLSAFEELEDQQKIAALLNTGTETDDEPGAREKALTELVVRIKRHTLDKKIRGASTGEALQQLILERNKLQKLHISLS